LGSLNILLLLVRLQELFITQHCIGKVVHAFGHHPTSETIVTVGIEIAKMSGIPTGKDEEQTIKLFQPPCQSLQARKYTVRPKNYGQGVRLLASANSLKRLKKQVSRDILWMRIN